MKPLFDRYNQAENPAVNWKLVWRSIITHYEINATASMTGEVKGEAIPKYAEYAEVVLEINDALSDLTASTVQVNLINNIATTQTTYVYAPRSG